MTVKGEMQLQSVGIKRNKPKKKVKAKEVISFDLKKVLSIISRYNIVHDSIILDSNKLNRRFYGFIDSNSRTIYINKGLDDKTRIQTIIHELVHAIKHEYGIKDNEKETEKDEEEIYKDLFRNTAY